MGYLFRLPELFCMYGCMYACICACVYACMHVCMSYACKFFLFPIGMC